MVCLETTFLIDVLKKDPNVKSLIESLEGTEPLFVASPSIMELWSGAQRAELPEAEKIKINSLLASVITLPLDEETAKKAGEIEAILAKLGEMIDIEDIMIAAIAKINNEKLITRDQHYARIEGLQIEKY